MPVAVVQRGRFKLRTILLAIYLLVLIIPIGSIYSFRLYENELVRQTEIELIAQGAFIAASYKQAIQPLIVAAPSYGIPARIKPEKLDEKYNIIRPEVDVASAKIHPPRPDAQAPISAPDSRALKAGRIIFPIVDEATLTTLAGVRITDYQGTVVAGRDEVGMSLAHVEEVALALKGQYTSLLRQRISKHEPPPLSSLSRGTGVRLFVAMPIVDHDRVLGVILLSRSPRTILQGLQTEQRRMIIAVGLIIAITALLALLTSRAISSPIHALIRQTQQVAKGDNHVQPIEEPVTQELALLSHNVARMAETIAQRSDYIRNFAMHVSHEFKTPLTAIQGAIELIHEHGDSMTPEQFRKFLSNITQDADRLKMLVTRLLELARADVMQPREEATELAPLIRDLQAYYHDKIRIIADHINAMIPLPDDIARTVLGNLIENSFQHGASELLITAEQTPSHVVVRVSDNGRGISEANAQKLFTPFFTTKREEGGTGLGLVVIRSLLAAYRSDIHCIPQSQGACFELLLATT